MCLDRWACTSSRKTNDRHAAKSSSVVEPSYPSPTDELHAYRPWTATAQAWSRSSSACAAAHASASLNTSTSSVRDPITNCCPDSIQRITGHGSRGRLGPSYLGLACLFRDSSWARPSPDRGFPLGEPTELDSKKKNREPSWPARHDEHATGPTSRA